MVGNGIDDRKENLLMDMFERGRGFEYKAFCAECGSGLSIPFFPGDGTKYPERIFTGSSSSSSSSEEEEEEEDEDDSDWSAIEFWDNGVNEVDDIVKRENRQMEIRIYKAPDGGIATKFHHYQVKSLASFQEYTDLLNERIEKEKNRKVEKIREKLLNVITPGDYLYMKEKNLL